MKSNMQCNENDRAGLVERYVLGGMHKKERLAYEAHLQRCEACKKQLKESQKIVAKLKSAAQSAGWTENQVAQIDRLYSRGSLLQNINWRLAMKIAIILIVIVILPFLWWANSTETKLALMVTLERETGLLESETDQNVRRSSFSEHHHAHTHITPPHTSPPLNACLTSRRRALRSMNDHARGWEIAVWSGIIQRTGHQEGTCRARPHPMP